MRKRKGIQRRKESLSQHTLAAAVVVVEVEVEVKGLPRRTDVSSVARRTLQERRTSAPVLTKKRGWGWWICKCMSVHIVRCDLNGREAAAVAAALCGNTRRETYCWFEKSCWMKQKNVSTPFPDKDSISQWRKGELCSQPTALLPLGALLSEGVRYHCRRTYVGSGLSVNKEY